MQSATKPAKTRPGRPASSDARNVGVRIARTTVGVLLLLTGVVWIGQGTNMIGGSSMSGHAGYAVLGMILFVVGLALLLWSRRTRSAQRRVP
jgi:protein-S-isoprenylcysteine O-methyltransferase Ste14